MGLFSRKNEEDFLTQQAKEEGRLTDFEENSQAEIYDFDGEFSHIELNKENTGRNKSSQKFNSLSNASKLLEQFFDPSAHKPNQNNEPLYRQYRHNKNHYNNKKPMESATKGFIPFGIVLLILLSVFGFGLLGIFGFGLLVFLLAGKNSK